LIVDSVRRSHSSTIRVSRDATRCDVARLNHVAHIESITCESVREALTWQLVVRRETRGFASLRSVHALAAVISALVMKQLSSLFCYRKLYESVFESYLFSGGASSIAAELAKPPMPVTV